MRGKYSAEKLLIEMLELDPVEFIGICKIMGVDIYEFDEKNEEGNEEENVECAGVVVEEKDGATPRNFADIWCDVCDTIDGYNRVRRRNLGQLIYAATKKEK